MRVQARNCIYYLIENKDILLHDKYIVTRSRSFDEVNYIEPKLFTRIYTASINNWLHFVDVFYPVRGSVLLNFRTRAPVIYDCYTIGAELLL